MTRVLVTGFEPFGGERFNASQEAVRMLEANWAGEHDLVTAILPVSFSRAPAALHEVITRSRPDAVVCVGEAGNRVEITPERWAVNRQEARIPDNDGARPSGPIDAHPYRLAARLDVDGLVTRLRSAGLPATVSNDAGQFVCNATFRALLTGFPGPGGFIHVPAVRRSRVAALGQAAEGDPAMRQGWLDVEDLARGLEHVVRSMKPPLIASAMSSHRQH